MNITCGTDIIEIERIKKGIEKFGEKFLNEIYTKKEIEYCEGKNEAKYEHYAARFAAKEAIFKAISSKLPSDIGDIWTNIEIKNNQNHKPIANLERLNLSSIESMDLSLSHIAEYAVASFNIIFK